MKTTDVQTDKKVLIKTADILVEAQRELDELTVQLALGKAEALDKFEEIKRDFRSKIATLKATLHAEGLIGVSKDIKARIEKLELALTERKTENREMFVAQKRLILKSLLVLEAEIRKHLPDREDIQRLLHEFESFKLKLEILRLRFELKRFSINESLHHNTEEVRRRVNAMLFKAHMAVEKAKHKTDSLKKQVHVSYLKLG